MLIPCWFSPLNRTMIKPTWMGIDSDRSIQRICSNIKQQIWHSIYSGLIQGGHLGNQLCPFPKPPNLTSWSIFGTAVWPPFPGLTDGDQVQLTKGWQQNSELQFLGGIQKVELGHLGWRFVKKLVALDGTNMYQLYGWSCKKRCGITMANVAIGVIAHLCYTAIAIVSQNCSNERTWFCNPDSLFSHIFHSFSSQPAGFSTFVLNAFSHPSYLTLATPATRTTIGFAESVVISRYPASDFPWFFVCFTRG